MRPVSPRLMLITLAPLSAAHLMPLTIVAWSPEPTVPRTRTGMIMALGAAPAMPTPLSVTAAAMPATCVPWPFWSMGSSSLATKSYPLTILSLRSGWLVSTPVSMMAMTTSSPLAVCQDWGSFMAGTAHCWGSSGSGCWVLQPATIRMIVTESMDFTTQGYNRGLRRP